MRVAIRIAAVEALVGGDALVHLTPDASAPRWLVARGLRAADSAESILHAKRVTVTIEGPSSAHPAGAVGVEAAVGSVGSAAASTDASACAWAAALATVVLIFRSIDTLIVARSAGVAATATLPLTLQTARASCVLPETIIALLAAAALHAAHVTVVALDATQLGVAEAACRAIAVVQALLAQVVSRVTVAARWLEADAAGALATDRAHAPAAVDPALPVGEHAAHALATRAFEGVVATAAAIVGRRATTAAATAIFAL